MQAAPIEGTHRSINQKIDETYIRAIECAAELQDYLDDPKGLVTGAYKRFKNPFYQLFLLTHDIKEMRTCSAVSDKVETWVNRPISAEAAREGLQLFTHYQRCLFDNLIISRRDIR